MNKKPIIRILIDSLLLLSIIWYSLDIFYNLFNDSYIKHLGLLFLVLNYVFTFKIRAKAYNLLSIFMLIFGLLALPLSLFYDDFFISCFYIFMPISIYDAFNYDRYRKGKRTFIVIFIILFLSFIFINLGIKFFLYDSFYIDRGYNLETVYILYYVLGFLYIINRAKKLHDRKQNLRQTK